MDTTRATSLALATLAVVLLLGHCDTGPGFGFVRAGRTPKPTACAPAPANGAVANGTVANGAAANGMATR